MIPSIQFCWPEGRTGALTTSWDDGTIYDRSLLAIMNRYGIKGTFNLNSGKWGLSAAQSHWKEYIQTAEVPKLYEGHELAGHTCHHPFPTTLPDAVVRSELAADRAALEEAIGEPVFGFVLPYGDGHADPRIQRLIREAGFLYARQTRLNVQFEPPQDFLQWGVTCHHKHPELTTLWDQFLAHRRPRKLFYLWGHSYEFEEDRNWALIEAFCDRAAQANSQVWMATNGQIYDYLQAWHNLRWSTDLRRVANPSATPVHLLANSKPFCVSPGQTVCLS